MNESLKEICKFNCQPITAFRQNKNPKVLIRSNKFEKNKVKKKTNTEIKPGKCSPCLTNLRSLCCQQVRKKATFKSQQTEKTYKIFHNVNCTSSYVVYLMEYFLCNKQYVGKAEISFNIRLIIEKI